MHKKTQKHPSKMQPRKLSDTATHAAKHVVVFCAISLAGHFVTASLSASVGAIGAGMYPAIGGMIML